MQTRRKKLFVYLIIATLLSGCATTTPYVGKGPHPQIVRGRACPPIDALANILAFYPKLLLWNWKVSNHSIGEETEQEIVEYLDAHEELIGDTLVRLNQWSPHGEFKRLFTNKHVALPYRIILGIPVTLIESLFGRLLGGDNYNPWTNTINIYSDIPAIALHEGGHSVDFLDRKYTGTYAVARIIPFVDLYQEYRATDNAIDYLIDTEKREYEFQAYRILYPAYGTYAGRYLPYGTIPGAITGHIVGYIKIKKERRYYLMEENYKRNESIER